MLNDPARQRRVDEVDAGGPRCALAPLTVGFGGCEGFIGAVDAIAAQGQGPIDGGALLYHAAGVDC
jgi:hypothetical protein